jgi:hypothetical protein
MPVPFPPTNDDALLILWGGSDLAKLTALQAALRDEGIRFWDTMVYHPSVGVLSSEPYYMQATRGFEIRVRSSDLERAKTALEWVERKENSQSVPGERSTPGGDPLDPKQELPYDWDSNEATSEAWAGEDEPMADYLASALRENGIPSRIPDDPGHRVRLCVRPEDLTRARDIVREITEGAAPA